MKINGKTKIFGILGFPVSHTFSPCFHNAAFEALKMNAVYAPFEVSPEGLNKAFQGLAALGVCGVNVTMPHKQAAIPLLDKLSPGAKAIGAVNTVLFKDGKTMGHNTDAEGFLLSLKDDLKVNPKGKSVLIFGSGGAARAISYVLGREGAKSITLVDIVDEKAMELARKTKKDFPACRTEAISFFMQEAIDEKVLNSDILINASIIGLKSRDSCIIKPATLHKKLAVYDIIYNPPITPLLKEAKKRGLKSAGGIGMLLYQGAASFELFTGRKAPVPVMRRACVDALRRALGKFIKR
ncbi:MAG: shikimate dehydrogenase [Candidatus Omnitrophota bacterium]